MAQENSRELVIKARKEEEVKKVDALRIAGINITELVLGAIMQADIEKLKLEIKEV